MGTKGRELHWPQKVFHNLSINSSTKKCFYAKINDTTQFYDLTWDPTPLNLDCIIPQYPRKCGKESQRSTNHPKMKVPNLHRSISRSSISPNPSIPSYGPCSSSPAPDNPLTLLSAKIQSNCPNNSLYFSHQWEFLTVFAQFRVSLHFYWTLWLLRAGQRYLNIKKIYLMKTNQANNWQSIE